MSSGASVERYRALFEPRGVIVAGASSHPGKFGFVAAHNVLAHGYKGEVFLTNRDGAEVLGRRALASIDEVPDGAADLVFVCTPAPTAVDIVRAAAARGVRAAFVASGGFRESGDSGAAAERELVSVCDELGVLLAGPNGQGVISTPVSLCAQIVAPNPPPGRIAVASQSGGFVQAFLNYARAVGVGVSRAVSAGNAAQTGVEDFVEFFAEDDATDVALVYLEGITDGRRLYEKLAAAARRKPVVVLKGGATAAGAKAAASHTGALAADDRVFDGVCRQAGLVRADGIRDAFLTAATFATQPLPRGPRVFVLTTLGGWGVLTADRIAASRELELAAFPDDLRAFFDERLPPRWSRSNPADLAGLETRDTLVECLARTAIHPEVDAVVLLGIGVQSNLGELERHGPFFPDHGLERIVAFHARQDARYAEAAVDAARAGAKPVVVVSELAEAAPDNPGMATLRQRGGMAHPSAEEAIGALERMVRYARWRRDLAANL